MSNYKELSVPSPNYKELLIEIKRAKETLKHHQLVFGPPKHESLCMPSIPINMVDFIVLNFMFWANMEN